MAHLNPAFLPLATTTFRAAAYTLLMDQGTGQKRLLCPRSPAGDKFTSAGTCIPVGSGRYLASLKAPENLSGIFTLVGRRLMSGSEVGGL